MLVMSMAWANDGKGFYVTERDKSTGYLRPQVGFVSRTTGHFRNITKATDLYWSPSLSGDNRTLAVVQGKRIPSLYLVSSAGFVKNLTPPALAYAKNISDFGWATSSELYIAEGSSLFRVFPEKSSKTALVSDLSAFIIGPAACSNGRFIMFSWPGHDTRQDIWRMDSSGLNLKQLTQDDPHATIPYCVPDGKWVYYANWPELGRLKRVPIQGGPSESVPGLESFVSWNGGISRDEKTLTYLTTGASGSSQQGQNVIAIVSVDASIKAKTKYLIPDQRISGAPLFTPDDKAVVYAIAENGVDNLYIQPLDGSRGHQITNFSSDSIEKFQFSSDGKRLGILQYHSESDVVLLRDSGRSAE